MMMFEYS